MVTGSIVRAFGAVLSDRVIPAVSRKKTRCIWCCLMRNHCFVNIQRMVWYCGLSTINTKPHLIDVFIVKSLYSPQRPEGKKQKMSHIHMLENLTSLAIVDQANHAFVLVGNTSREWTDCSEKCFIFHSGRQAGSIGLSYDTPPPPPRPVAVSPSYSVFIHLGQQAHMPKYAMCKICSVYKIYIPSHHPAGTRRRPDWPYLTASIRVPPPLFRGTHGPAWSGAGGGGSGVGYGFGAGSAGGTGGLNSSASDFFSHGPGSARGSGKRGKSSSFGSAAAFAAAAAATAGEDDGGRGGTPGSRRGARSVGGEWSL